MQNCLNCLDEKDGQCYECWLMGDSTEAKQYRSECLNREFDRFFGGK